MLTLLNETIAYVIATLIHNLPILAFGILVAAAIKVYVDPEKMKQLIMKRTASSITGSVALGAFTPFCACGTMAVILSMLTTTLPWGPIMAFLTSSPLMSPDEFILYSGIISLKFAVALTAASVIIGISSGYITHFIEKHTTFLSNQARFAEKTESCNCAESELAVASTSCCPSDKTEPKCSCTEIPHKKTDNFFIKYKLRELLKVSYELGVKKVLLYFTVFAAVGFLINKLVPAELIMKYLGSGNILAVPLLAFIGLPLYVNGTSAIPIINSLILGGASQGALLAFMITGPGTSAGVIAGLVTIMKKRAIALYVAYLIIFAIVLGYLYDFLLILGM